jgi:hypothetical protein
VKAAGIGYLAYIKLYYMTFIRYLYLGFPRIQDATTGNDI